RYRIYGYLASRKRNKRRNMANWLDPDAPTIAKVVQKVGYVTAHFGKWHMGGAHDIGNAPLPKVYGYDKTLVDFTGLGDRILVRNGLPGGQNKASAELGRGHTYWVNHRYQKLHLFVDSTMAFIKHHEKQPFYVEFWPEVVHDPWNPGPS